MRWLRPFFLVFIRLIVPVSLIMLAVPLAQAQSQGVAMIATPLDGATVAGIVPILGTATHPQFLRYELAFSYSPNPTDTWFTLQDPAKTPVVNEVLGRWDTTGITDGVYTLRLRVYWTERLFMEAFARDVHVQNATPLSGAPAAATPLAPQSPLPPTASATPAIVLPPTSTPRPTAVVAGANTTSRPSSPAPSWLDKQIIGQAFLTGLMVTVSFFVLVSLYLGIKAALRYRPRR
jgi:hypothetical protein